ncbi:YMR122W-A [Zygosaccharomyces parabailii]|nr:YMR122W-A [Zygosaccharomyces parabailii]CDH13119.1 uncharacterized protein ZBAI_04905 [Zygosaccharomyces bailii ISA1307]
MSFGATLNNTASGIGSNYSSSLISNYSSTPVTTNTRLVHTNVVAPSSVTGNYSSPVTTSPSSYSNSSSDSLTSASSGSLTSASPTISGSNEKNAAVAGLIAKPLSWKYGVALGAVVAGSFVLGSGI